MTGDTLPKLLKQQAAKSGHRRPALREKEFGLWQSITWQDYYDHVKFFSLGMLTLGLKKGDKVAIVGDNRPEWIYAELASQVLGAIPVGIYQESIPAEVSCILNLTQVKIVVAEDQEQCDKILDLLDELPFVEYIIYHDSKGMRAYNHPKLIYFPEVEAQGRLYTEAHPEFFDHKLESAREDDGALISITSGVAGKPKLALLSHKNLVQTARNLGEVDKKYPGDEFVSCLPLPWIGEQMMAVASALLFGFTVNFPERQETAQENVREIGPHLIFSPPRVWENLAAMVQIKMVEASFFKRFIYAYCLAIGYYWAELKFQKKVPSLGAKIKHKIAYLLVFRALKDRLGFSNVRCAATGGAALGPDTFRFFHALGINLKQIYGQTEFSGISCMHYDGDVDFNSVGKPLPGTEIKISDKGEILSRCTSLFLGYYENMEATTETIVDGWLHSGDAGYFNDQGHLVVIDRLEDLMTLADGTKFSPQFIENKLKFSPYIKTAVALGHRRAYLAVLICIDYEMVGKWAESKCQGYTSYADLTLRETVCEMIEGEVLRVNESLPDSVRIKKFVLLCQELDVDAGELTQTHKVRRGFVDEKYRTLIEGLYAGQNPIHLETSIGYQDGQRCQLKTAIKVRSLRMAR